MLPSIAQSGNVINQIFMCPSRGTREKNCNSRAEEVVNVAVVDVVGVMRVDLIIVIAGAVVVYHTVAVVVAS